MIAYRSDGGKVQVTPSGEGAYVTVLRPDADDDSLLGVHQLKRWYGHLEVRKHRWWYALGVVSIPARVREAIAWIERRAFVEREVESQVRAERASMVAVAEVEKMLR